MVCNRARPNGGKADNDNIVVNNRLYFYIFQIYIVSSPGQQTVHGYIQVFVQL